MINKPQPENTLFSDSIKNKAFQEKLQQTLGGLDAPLLILNLGERNPNYVMYTLVEEHASPTALIIYPDGGSRLIINSIELDMVRHLEKQCLVELYGGMGEFYKCLNEALPLNSKIYVEISEQMFGLDTIPRRLFNWLEDKYELLSAQDILVKLRSYKTASELAFIQDAVAKTLDIFTALEPLIKPGTTEETISQTIMTAVISQSAGISFKPIVASGPRIVNPHPVRQTQRALREGDWLIIDFGLSINGYTSDLTRTYLIAGDYQQHQFYQTYQQMLQLLLAEDLTQATPQSLAIKIQEIARQNGLADYEKHGYGHGLGVAIHDIYPSISTYKGHLSEIPFSDNVVFTFEPGFYAQNEPLGFRIENDFLVRNGQAIMIGKP